jgi:DNA-directed RNA polymerase specialized sigma subunit
MTAVVMDDLLRDGSLQREAARLNAFDRLVLQLRWAEELTRAETALVLEADPASVLAAEMRLRAWLERLSRSRA